MEGQEKSRLEGGVVYMSEVQRRKEILHTAGEQAFQSYICVLMGKKKEIHSAPAVKFSSHQAGNIHQVGCPTALLDNGCQNHILFVASLSVSSNWPVHVLEYSKCYQLMIILKHLPKNSPRNFVCS